MSTPTVIQFPQGSLTILPKGEGANIDLVNLATLLAPEPHSLTSHYVINASLEEVATVMLVTHKLIEAAGGIVANSAGAVLMIFRRGFWDLPKGKIDQGETPKIAAVREVEEETGVQPLQVIKHIGNTYHTYFMYDTYAFKKTYWYEMNTAFEANLLPQMEEDIESAVWMTKAELQHILDKTYPNIKSILTKYLEL